MRQQVRLFLEKRTEEVQFAPTDISWLPTYLKDIISPGAQLFDIQRRLAAHIPGGGIPGGPGAGGPGWGMGLPALGANMIASLQELRNRSGALGFESQGQFEQRLQTTIQKAMFDTEYRKGLPKELQDIAEAMQLAREAEPKALEARERAKAEAEKRIPGILAGQDPAALKRMYPDLDPEKMTRDAETYRKRKEDEVKQEREAGEKIRETERRNREESRRDQTRIDRWTGGAEREAAQWRAREGERIRSQEVDMLRELRDAVKELKESNQNTQRSIGAQETLIEEFKRFMTTPQPPNALPQLIPQG
jgi:hypothetical protein